VERRLVGVLVISLIVGSLISLYLIREKIETPVSLIDESYPKRALAGTSDLDKDKYSLAFICREDLKQVAVRFAYLMQARPNLTEASAKVGDLKKAGEKVDQISRRVMVLREMGYEPEITVSEVQVGGRKKSVVIYDFSSKLDPVLPPDGSSYYRTVFAIIVNRSKMIDGYFEGVSDFFFMRGLSLQSLEITRNANKTVYMAAKNESELKEGALPISRAPEYGRIVIDDLKRNDRVSIVCRTNSRYTGYPNIFLKGLSFGKYLIQVIKFEIDGELAEDKILVHVIENGAHREEV